MLDAIRAQRDRIFARLGAIPAYGVPVGRELRAVHAAAGRDAAEVWQALLDRGVCPRPDAVVPRALRVTAGTEDETTQFLDALTGGPRMSRHRRASTPDDEGDRRRGAS